MSQAHIDAAKASKDGATRFVIYIPDDGEMVWTAEQLSIWRNFVMVEGAYLNGVKVAA